MDHSMHHNMGHQMPMDDSSAAAMCSMNVI